MIQFGKPFASGQPLSVTREVTEQMITHSRGTFPQEATGILGGHGQQITQVIPVPNRTRKLDTFHWEAVDFFSALHELRLLDLEWGGVFHSHPRTSSIPSMNDQKNWHYPDLSYWICSLVEWEKPEITLFRWQGGRFARWPFHTL